MKPAGFAPAQGAVARADLLRLLASAPRPLLVLDDAGEHGLAYREQPRAEPALAAQTVVVPDRNPPAAISASPYKLPLQMPFAHVVAERYTREPPAAEPDPTPRLAVEPISEDDAKPLAERRLVDYEDLVPKARLLPALKRHLAHDRLGGLDVSTLVRQIAGQQLPRHLPRRRLQTWHPQWVVVLDFCQRLWPYRQDMHRLADRLLRQCGESGISLRIVNHGPLNPWSDWLEEQRSHGPLPAKRPWRMPAAGTPVLLVSDLGLLEGAQSATHHAWLRFIGQLSQAQTRPWALLPLGADQLDRDLPKALSLLRWSPDARMHPERAFGGYAGRRHAGVAGQRPGLAGRRAVGHPSRLAALHRPIEPSANSALGLAAAGRGPARPRFAQGAVAVTLESGRPDAPGTRLRRRPGRAGRLGRAAGDGRRHSPRRSALAAGDAPAQPACAAERRLGRRVLVPCRRRGRCGRPYPQRSPGPPPGALFRKS
ncbi:hypothetical protein [Methylomonas sp. LWB]|uniref:hypothetical protein n=1 Tax=Methylomonas sp. LWB TaxID=1905845 RepID=UPI001587E515|nr:hypothetical protein [Methylomonas sp. LWB]